MNGLESFVLRNRLAQAGFEPSVFRYPSTQADIGEAAAALATHLHGFGDGPVAFDFSFRASLFQFILYIVSNCFS